nr:MAG TPA: hypothetical protein [Microviridae sp.]
MKIFFDGRGQKKIIKLIIPYNYKLFIYIFIYKSGYINYNYL